MAHLGPYIIAVDMGTARHKVVKVEEGKSCKIKVGQSTTYGKELRFRV